MYTATSRDDTSNGGYTGSDSTGANEPSSTTTAAAIIKTTTGDHGEGDGDEGRGGGDVSSDAAAVTESGVGDNNTGDALETTTKARTWRDAYDNWFKLRTISPVTEEPRDIVS